MLSAIDQICEGKRKTQITTYIVMSKTGAGADLSANERAFILEALQQNVRLDGRALDQFRPLEIEFGAEFGHVIVRLGKTR